MKAGALFKPIKNFDNNLAHLYEHYLILDFHRKLGLDTASTFGWVGGKTFEDYLFIDYGFYNPKIEKSFTDYLSQKKDFNEKQILEALSIINLEDKIKYRITNLELLISQLEELENMPWNIDKNSQKPLPKVIKQIKQQEPSYITTTIKLNSDDPNLHKLFLRFKVIIDDIIQRNLDSNYPNYSQGFSPITIWNEGKYADFIKVNAFEAVEHNAILKLCQNTIKNFDLEKNYQNIKHHFDYFREEPLWQDVQIDYYKYSGVITNNQKIAQLATIDNLQQILNKLSFEISKTNQDDFDSLV